MRFSKGQKEVLGRWSVSDIPPLTISYIPVPWPPGGHLQVSLEKPVLYIRSMGLIDIPAALHSTTSDLNYIPRSVALH